MIGIDEANEMRIQQNSTAKTIKKLADEYRTGSESLPSLMIH